MALALFRCVPRAGAASLGCRAAAPVAAARVVAARAAGEQRRFSGSPRPPPGAPAVPAAVARAPPAPSPAAAPRAGSPPPAPPGAQAGAAGVGAAAPAPPSSAPTKLARAAKAKPAAKAKTASTVKTPAAALAKKKKVAAKRDPDRPKRPQSVWVRFSVDFRKQHPELKGPAVLKAAAVDYKKLTPAQLKPYQDAYEAEKKVYDQKFEEYAKSGKKAAWKRDPERPKKPLTGYMRFVQHFRTANPTVTKVTELTRQASVQWKAMTPQAKAPYEEKYKAEKEQFDKLMLAYKESGKEAAWKEKKGLLEIEKPVTERATKATLTPAKTKVAHATAL